MKFQTQLKSAVLQLRWKIIFPLLAKSRAHVHTKYEYGHETLQGMGKIIFQRNCNTLYRLYTVCTTRVLIKYPLLLKPRYSRTHKYCNQNSSSSSKSFHWSIFHLSGFQWNYFSELASQKNWKNNSTGNQRGGKIIPWKLLELVNWNWSCGCNIYESYCKQLLPSPP